LTREAQDDLERLFDPAADREFIGRRKARLDGGKGPHRSLELRVGRTRRELVIEQDRQDTGLAWWQRLANVFVLSRRYAGPLPADAVSDRRLTPATLAVFHA
jgi:hypothetical protein